MVGGFMYNFKQKKFNNIYEKSFSDFLICEYQNGLYHIEDEYCFDILINNFDKVGPNSKKVLICFSGAIGDRKNKIGPFFSGLGISKELNLPLISFSDPVVSGTDVNLGWYAGSLKSVNLQQKILIILNNLIDRYSAELVFFGGSGGGFASLFFATAIQKKTQCLVWNPQTILENYHQTAVDNYIKHGFETDKINKGEQIYLFKKRGICHDITELKENKSLELIYLQNESDFFHVNNHLKPYMGNKVWNEININTLQYKNQFIHYGNWGEGYAVPHKKIILKFLLGLVNNDIFSVLNNNFNDQIQEEDSEICLKEFKISPRIKSENGFLSVNIQIYNKLGCFQNNNLKYALYLKYKDSFVEKHMYQSSNSFEIDIQSFNKVDLIVTCFVRDLSGKSIMNNFRVR